MSLCLFKLKCWVTSALSRPKTGCCLNHTPEECVLGWACWVISTAVTFPGAQASIHGEQCAPPALPSAATSGREGPVCCSPLPGQTGGHCHSSLPGLPCERQGPCDNFHIRAFLGQLWQSQGTPHYVLYVHKECECVLTFAYRMDPRAGALGF